MKAIVCELCGGNEFIKQDGMFVCQFCGTKYTVEEVKKLMVEGTVKIDNTDLIDNYLDMAKNAYDGGNGQSAFDYANKALEINPKNSEAWLIKMKTIEKLGTLGDARVSEAIEAGKNAIMFSDNKSETEKEVYAYYINRANELILICIAEFLDVTELKNHKLEFSLISFLTADYNTAQIDLPKLNIYQGVTTEAFKLIDEITIENFMNKEILNAYKTFISLVKSEKEALLARVKVYELAVNMDVINNSIPSLEKYEEIYKKKYWEENPEEREVILKQIEELEMKKSSFDSEEIRKKVAEIDDFDKKIKSTRSQLAVRRLKKEKEELMKKYSKFTDRLEEINNIEKEIEELKSQLL